MKLRTIEDVEHFQEAIDNCESDVWLSSQNEHFNLKSEISKIIAIGRVLSGDESLELFAHSKLDEQNLVHMFQVYPEMM